MSFCDPRVTITERAIAEMLITLERELGREVTDVKTERIELTSFSDDKQRFTKHIVISVAPDEINTWA